MRREKKTNIATSILHIFFFGRCYQEAEKNSLSKSQRKSMLNHVESTYPWLLKFQRFQMVLLEAVFFSNNCPSQYLRFAGVFSPDLRCSSSLVPLEDLMSKCCQITHPGSRKIWRMWWFFLQLKEDSRRRFMGHEMFFSPIKLGSEQIRPLNGRFFLFPWLLEKEYAKLKRTSSWLVTSDFYQWSLQLLFKVVDVFFLFGFQGWTGWFPAKKVKHICDSKKSPIVSMILEGCWHVWRFWMDDPKTWCKFNFWGVSNFLCLTLQGVIWSFTTFQLHLSFGGGNHDVYAHLVLSDELDLSHPHWVTSYTSHATLPMETFRRHWHGSCHFGAPWQCFMTKSLAASWCQCLHVLVWKTWWNFRPDKPWQTNSSLNLAINLDVQIE